MAGHGRIRAMLTGKEWQMLGLHARAGYQATLLFNFISVEKATSEAMHTRSPPS